MPGERGVALVAALVVLALVSAMGLGLVLTTSLEPAAAANYEQALQARYAAEAGVALAAHELAALSDWNAVLAGLAVSRMLDPTGAEVVLPDGTRRDVARLTSLAGCRREDGCSQGDLDAFTADRPWGPNNPRWTPFGVLTLEGAARGLGGRARVVAVVWVGDDPAEADGAPLRDTPSDPGGTARRPR
jgi:hypothetical protein